MTLSLDKWITCKLNELLLTLETGSRPQGGVKEIREGVPSIGGEHLTCNGTFDFTKIKFVPRDFADRMSKGHIQKYDILIVKDGATTGKTAFVDDNFPYKTAVVNEHVFICRVSEVTSPKFVFRYLMSEEGRNEILKNFQGSAQGGINSSFASKVEVPLAPVNEQHRILAKLEKLLTKVDNCKERLDRIPAILKRFRQSVLAAACSGRLTADWREKNPDVEPASELLRRIQENRDKGYSAKDIAGTGKINRQVNPGKLYKTDSFPFPTEDYPDDHIPSTWIWVRFGNIIGELRNGVSLRPNQEPPGTPILRINAVRSGKVDLSEIRYLPEGERFIPTYLLHEGDLLFTRYNGSIDLLGVCGMVRVLNDATLLYPDKLMRVRFDHKFVKPQYAEIYFQAPFVRHRVTAKSKSSAGQNGVSGTDIKNQVFALPPLEEQLEIVRRVEALFKIGDQVEARYEKAKAYVDRLTQAILAKAFRGELVPQDPDDEPASVLLARIREERARREADLRTARHRQERRPARRRKKAGKP